MSKGIYGYYDKENNYICVNIGKDSHINENRRHKQHLYPSRYDEQQFNRVLQNNQDRYEYRVICEYPDLTDDELNYLEIKEIMKHKFLYGERPKFNFTIGGDGISGYTFTDESKKKMGESKKGSVPWNKGKTGCYSDETKRKMGESNKGEKSSCWKNYARIIKYGFHREKQSYAIKFNGGVLRNSTNIELLIKWFNSNYPDEELVVDESIKLE